MFVFFGMIGTKPRAATSSLFLRSAAAAPAQTKNPAAPQPDFEID
jgi:hypothetical protein